MKSKFGPSLFPHARHRRCNDEGYWSADESSFRHDVDIDSLAPNNDFVLALNSVPIVKGIPYHTICGDRGCGDTPDSSDGVIPYWNSHLPGALSEKIVPSRHCAHPNQQAIEEVHRILKLHSTSR